jgi:flagellar basal body-associated protein FliL
MWIIVLVVVVVLAVAAMFALRRFGPARNPERLRQVDAKAADRLEQQIAQHQQYTQQGRNGTGGGF